MQKKHPTIMKLIYLLLSIFLSQGVLAQSTPTLLDKSLIPKSFNINDSIFQAYKWTYDLSENIVVLTLNKSKNEEDLSNGNLNVFYYTIKNDSIKRQWRIYDFINDCDVDLIVYFLNNSFNVTDLNSDGKPEIWIMYKLSCQGDVSPVTMKIIMYEDRKKYAVRGATRVKVSDNETFGGDFIFDENFKLAPKEFRDYAEKLWDLHKIEKWQE
jgi:hypothetical protein